MKWFALTALGFACGCAPSFEHTRSEAQPGRRLAVAHPLETFDPAPAQAPTATTHTQAPMQPMQPPLVQPASYSEAR